MTETIQQFFDACHPFGYPLLACSIALVAAILYHIMTTIGEREINKLARQLTSPSLADYCATHPSPLALQVTYTLQEEASDKLTAITESRLRLFIDSQRAGMTTINIITNIAPMLGILGTAWGLVDIFGVFGSPSADQGIALGISKALYTTIFGLAIAVPGIIALACFERALERKAALINDLFTSLLASRHNP